MADYFNTKHSKIKPFQCTQTIIDSAKMYLESDKIDIHKHIERINLQLNTNNYPNTLYDGWKQFSYPVFSQDYKEFSVELLDKLFTGLNYSKNMTISIIAGDILKYSAINKLITIIKNLKSNKKLIIQSSIFPLNDKELIKFKEISEIFDTLSIYVDSLSFFDCNSNNSQLSDIKNANFIFTVRNFGEFKKIKNIVKRLNLERISIIPFYDSKNNNFFLRNVFVNSESFDEFILDMHEILLNKIINRFKYGELTILQNGTVYSDTNLKRIGNLHKKNIGDIILHEIKNGKSWKLTRNKVDPCKNCIYCDLCPPISNYELCIGKYNLCTIVK